MNDDLPRDRAYWTHEVQRRDVAYRAAIQDKAPAAEIEQLRAARAEADEALARSGEG